MYDEHDEDREFWSRVDGHRSARTPRTTRTPRTPGPARPARPPQHTARHTAQQPVVRSRSHHDGTGPITRTPSITGAIPVISQRVREAGSQVDPMMRRIGALAVVVALAIPVAMALRSGGEADATAPADLPRYSAAATTAALATSVTPAEAAADTEVTAAAQAASPWAAVDVNALPPAVPKHPEASAAPQSSAVATTAAPAPVVKAAAKPATSTKTVVNVAACSKQYTVRAGDAWVLIASKVDVSTKALLAANNATTATMLYPGRSICLPAGAKVSSTATKPSGSTSSATKPSGSTSSGTKKPSTTTTVAAAPRPANTYSKAQVEAIIRSVWPDALEDEAVRIATRESNLNPTVRNYCCYGLFQLYYSVHKSWLASIGVDSAADLYDPKVNAYAAYMLYLRSGGFRPWQ